MVTLVLGGARSGKSSFAESLCPPTARVAYIATLRPRDREMSGRVARHRAGRPASWITIEEPKDIAGALERAGGKYQFVLLDCLTIWLSNLCSARRKDTPDSLRAVAADQLTRLRAAAGKARCVIVSNEVGYGLVPMSPVGRAFRDLQGWVNQDIARGADFVYQVVAGIPITIKRPKDQR